MSIATCRRMTLVSIFASACFCAVPATAAQALPFDTIEAAVRSALAAERDLADDDLISRKQVARVLDAVQKAGWKTVDRAAIEKKTLDDGSYLVGKLQTSSGKKFMRSVGDLPLAYDRLDRLSQLPQGRNTVDKLIRGPDGDRLLEYMAKEKGGRELAKMLSRDGRGDFNQPTGKIYTTKQLIAELKRQHATASGSRRKTP